MVSRGRIGQLAGVFAKTWQRPPTKEELQALVDDFVLEEIYYREAVNMGIDRDDTVIRRRLRQKIEFLTDDVAALVEPSDEVLESYLAANEDRFRRDDRYTFEQVFIDPGRHKEDLGGHVDQQLAILREGGEADGDSGLLPRTFENASRQAVDSTFGIGFSGEMEKLAPGEWRGPVQSGLGVHLVRLASREEGTVPGLDEIRPLVEREWANKQRLEGRRRINEELRKQYEVTVEWPQAGEEAGSQEP